MTQRPIRIAGAGVSGPMATIRLAQLGAFVGVSERREDSGAAHPPRFDAIENWTTRVDLAHLRSFLARYPDVIDTLLPSRSSRKANTAG